MRKSVGSILVVAVALGGAACAPAAKTTRIAAASPAQASDAVSTTTLAAAVSDTHAEEDAKPESEPLPSACESEAAGPRSGKHCVVPRSFAKKVCEGIYPEIALSMFAKGSPWTRSWLAGDVDAWNASGGRTHRAKLAFDEEVIVLAKHGAAQTGGIVMTGAMASYDVLRFDGTCVSVMDGELTTQRPPKPKAANVSWNRLEEGMRHALLASPKVKSTHAAFEKACNMDDRKSCEKAERAFNQAVLEHVRSGASLPEPSRRP